VNAEAKGAHVALKQLHSITQTRVGWTNLRAQRDQQTAFGLDERRAQQFPRGGEDDRCEFALLKTLLGRCNLRAGGSELSRLLVAEFAPTSLAAPPTDPIVSGDLVAPDAGAETGSDMPGEGGLRPLPTAVLTEVVRDAGSVSRRRSPIPVSSHAWTSGSHGRLKKQGHRLDH
jgi:hypothetical protein